jgi:hypothetical protein
MKLNATSTNEVTIDDNRKKAEEQLKSTITYFNKTLSNNYLGLSLIAYIATPEHYPREDATIQSMQVRFLEEMGVILRESREHKS